MNNSPTNFANELRTGKCIRLFCTEPPFDGDIGYVGAVNVDVFEFDEVTNGYAHFSNVSDPPILKRHVIKVSDVTFIREYK
jgi:hypothetical protein